MISKAKDNSKNNSASARVIAKKINQTTEGIFSSLIDFTLYSLLLLPAASFGKSTTSRGIYEAFGEANALFKEINYHTFKNSWRKLTEKGLINSLKDWAKKEIATTEGKKRIQSLLPFYDEKRFWDGNLYIVQYDIPIIQNSLRNDFRQFFLKKLGAVMLQASSYLLFYNPDKLIKKYLGQKQEFEGNILVSKLTKDGFIGEAEIKEFIWDKANLSCLNYEYEGFLKKYSKDGFSKVDLIKDYLAILKKDPQIPFELLPDKYLGDEAYLVFLGYAKNTLFNMHVHKR